MDALRLLHFADLHLGIEAGGRTSASSGLNQRIHDVCDRLEEVCATAEREGVHAVVFAGDAFMNPRPSPTVQTMFAEGLRRLVRGGTAVFLLIGNHDLPKMAGIAHPHAIYAALEVEGVVIGDRAQVYRVALGPDAPAPELQVAALPHFSRAHVAARLPAEDPQAFVEEQIARRVRALGAAVDPELPSVFAGHCHVSQAEIGEGQTLFGVSDVEVSLSTLTSGQPFPYYALGHLHKRQVLLDDPFVAYSGSLERVDFGEGDRIDVTNAGKVTRRAGDAKGFYRADLVRDQGRWQLREKPQFHPVGARRFVTMRLGDIDAKDPAADVRVRLDAVRAAGEELGDACVRVQGSIEAADRGRLTLSAVKAIVPEAYDVRLSLETREGAVVRDPRFARRMTELEAFEAYLDTREDWSDDRDELLRLARELAAEVLT